MWVTVFGESGTHISVVFSHNSNSLTKIATGNGASQVITLTSSDVSTLGDDTVSIVATVSDSVLNLMNTSATSFVLDTQPPSVPSLTLGNGISNGNTANLTETTQSSGVIRVSGESGALLTTVFTDSSASSNKVTKTITLSSATTQAVVLSASDIGNGVGSTTLHDGVISVFGDTS